MMIIVALIRRQARQFLFLRCPIESRTAETHFELPTTRDIIRDEVGDSVGEHRNITFLDVYL